MKALLLWTLLLGVGILGSLAQLQGVYDFDDSCTPSRDCCCGQGQLTVQQDTTAAAADVLNVKGVLDGGEACFRETDIEGQCVVSEDDKGLAICTQNGIPISINITGDPSTMKDNEYQRVSFVSNLYPDCISTAQRKELRKGGDSKSAAFGVSPGHLSLLSVLGILLGLISLA